MRNTNWLLCGIQHGLRRFVWKNEEYRVTLPYAKFEFWYSEASWSEKKFISFSLMNESSCLRVQLKEEFLLGGILHLRLNSDVWETDSAQVPWGKDEKNSEKRVQRAWSCWNGRNLIAKKINYFYSDEILFFSG